MKKATGMITKLGKKVQVSGVLSAVIMATAITSNSFASDTTVLTRAVTKLIKANHQVNIMVNDLKAAVEANGEQIDKNSQNIAKTQEEIKKINSILEAVKKEASQAKADALYAKNLANDIVQVKKTSGEMSESAKLAYQRSLRLERKVQELEKSVKRLGEAVSRKSSSCAQNPRITQLENEIERLKRRLNAVTSSNTKTAVSSSKSGAPCCGNKGDTEADKIIRDYINEK